MNNTEQFLHAANWVLEMKDSGGDTGVNIRGMFIPSRARNRQILLFNVSKGLIYDGYKYPEQEYLKGLIVETRDNEAIKVLAPCFRKFYNYSEPAENNQ